MNHRRCSSLASTTLLLVAGIFLSAGCAGQNRLETLGVIKPVAPPPPSSLTTIEIPLQEGAWQPANAPVVVREGKRYLVALVDRREFYLSTGILLPQRIWNGATTPGPVPMAEAALSLDRLTTQIERIRQIQEKVRKSPTATAQLRERYASLSTIEAALADTMLAMADLRRVNAPNIPSETDPAKRIPKELAEVHRITERMRLQLVGAEEVHTEPAIKPHLADLEARLDQIDRYLAEANVARLARSCRDLLQATQELMNSPEWWKNIASGDAETEEQRWAVQRFALGLRESSLQACIQITMWLVHTEVEQPIPLLVY